MPDTRGANLLVGLLLLILGILLVVGYFSLGALIPYAGIVLIVVGILMLVDVLPGGVLLGVVGLVLGVLLVGNWIDLPAGIRDAMKVINLVVGILLIIFGALRLIRR